MGWGVWIGHSGPIKRATIMMMGATNIDRIYYPVCLVCQGRVHFLESALTLLHTPSQSSMLFITNCLGCIITHWAKAFRDSLSCVLWLLKLQFTWKNACKKISSSQVGSLEDTTAYALRAPPQLDMDVRETSLVYALGEQLSLKWISCHVWIHHPLFNTSMSQSHFSNATRDKRIR